MHPAPFTFDLTHAPSAADVASYFAEASASESTTSRTRDRGYNRDSDARDSDDERFNEKLKAGVPIPAFLPFYDTLQTAEETSVMRFAYRHMLADPTVNGAFKTQILPVMAADLSIKPPKWLAKDERMLEICEFVDWALSFGLNGGIPGLAWSVFSGGMMDGFSVCEKVWGEPEPKGHWSGKRRLAHLKAKDVNQDLVLEIDAFKNPVGVRGLRFNDGTVFSIRDFIIYTHMGLFENPTGMSLFRAAYRPYWLLDTTWKLRMIGVEKRSMPLILGQWQDPNTKSKLDAALAKIRYQNWISAPKDAAVTAVEIAGQSHQIFSETVRDLREEINVAISGATLASMTGTGERGDSNVHKDTGDLRPWQLQAALANILNDHDHGLIKDLVDRNFLGVQDYPIASFGGVDEKELGETVRVDQTLSTILQPMGKMLDPDEMQERYGRKFVDLPQPNPEDPNAPAPVPGDDDDGQGGGGGPGGGAGGGEDDDTEEQPPGTMQSPKPGEKSQSGLPWMDGAIETDPDDTSVADELSYDPMREEAQRSVGGPPEVDEDGEVVESDEGGEGNDDEPDEDMSDDALAEVLGGGGEQDDDDESDDDDEPADDATDDDDDPIAPILNRAMKGDDDDDSPADLFEGKRK